MRNLFFVMTLGLLFVLSAGTETPVPGEAESESAARPPEPMDSSDAVAEDAKPAAPFTLRDQFKDEHVIDFPRNSPLFLCFADPEGGEHVSPWYESAKERYAGDVTMLGVGLVEEFPRMMRPLVRLFLRKAAAEVPIMLDWDGSICEQYDFEPKVPNILLIDDEGQIVQRVNGRYSEEKKTELFAAVDQLVGETKTASN